jgi:hypothetical protein
MFINDRIKTAQLTLPNFAANAAIGTSVATVDLYSSFLINQTTAGRTLTLPVPSDTRAGDRAVIHNGGTVSFAIGTVAIAPGTFAHFHWNGTAWIPQLGDLAAAGQDFFRAVAGGLLPDGAADTTEAIRRLGGIGLGGALVTDALPDVTAPTATNVNLAMSNSAAGRGQLFFGSAPLSYYLSRTQSVTAGERVDIGTINAAAGNNGGYTIRLSIATSNSGNVISKHYIISNTFGGTNGVVQVVQPVSAKSRPSDPNNFELLYQSTGGDTNLWIRRTSGANAGVYRVRLEILGDGNQTFTESVAATVDATVYTIYQDEAPATEWLLGTSTTVDARSDKTNSIWREGRVRVGPVHRVGETTPYDYSNVSFLIGSPTPIGDAVTPVGTLNTDTVLRLIRGGTTGTNFDSSMDFRIGRWFADVNGRTRVDLLLGHGAVNVPDTTVMTWLSNGTIGFGHNITEDRLTNRLNLEGAANSLLLSIAHRLTGDPHPVLQSLALNHDNVAILFDAYWDGSGTRASHTSRPFSISKVVGGLNFFGSVLPPAAAGDPWTADLLGGWRYAGDPATHAGGELWFGNELKKRRIVFFDGGAANDHQFYGLGIVGSAMTSQVSTTSASWRWYAGASTSASNEVMTLLGTGRLGINTPTPLTPGHFQELGAAALPIVTIQNAEGTLREFVFSGATPNSVLTGRPGDIARGSGTPGTLWVKVTGVNTTTGWVQVAARAIYASTGVTDGSGNVVFTFPVSLFAVAPVCAIGIQTALTGTTGARITAISAASCTINVRRSPAVTILGISVLKVPVNASGVTVHAIFTVAG